MQVETREIIKYCDKYLKVKDFKDFCHNGLQIEGISKTSKIVSGLSLNRQLIETAIKKRAKTILVHHGIFNGEAVLPFQLKGVLRDRVKLLLENNINLIGYHLPLDAHPVIGVNISLLKILGLKKVGAINSPEYGDIGFVGEFKDGMKLLDFVALVEEKLETNTYAVASGSKSVKRVGIIGGAAPREYETIKELGADTFLTGEIRESSYWGTQEAKINFVAAGHYHTEKFGIQNLGELVAKKFNIKHEFVDTPCDL